MKKIKYVIALVVMIMGASASAELIIQDPLEHGFLTPPDSAKPWIFHCWMNGYVTKEGITKEFEEMKKAGVGGMQIFNVRTGFPRGPVSFNSPEWFELYAHAVKEAGRLGLELIFHNTGGFSGSGGPWVPVEDSMQMLVGSETRVRGPVKFSGKLPMPPVTQRSVEMGNFRGALEPFYRDIAVLAIKAPEGNVTTMLASSPVITASDPQFDFVKIIDGDPQTGAALPKPELGAYQYIQFEFPQPFSAQALTILAMPGQQSYAGELMVSDDGKTFKSVTKFSMESPAINPPILASSFRPVEGKFYRIIFTPGRAKVSKIEFGEIELQQGVRIPNWAEKSGFFRTTGMSGLAADTTWNVDAAQAVRLSGILDLTTAMKTDGSLAWDIPAGNWIILRLGHTSKGELSHPAPFGGEGLEVDKFSKEALDRCWAGHSAKLIAASGPLVGKALTGLHTDSYENGCQNWTPQFREEFKKRRGYDPLPYLPAMLGFPVESADISERFLWDLRRTYADLFADNFYGHLKTLAKQSGVQLSAQSFGIGNLDNLQAGGRIDIPQSEFWISNPVETSIIGKMASSIAHTTGKRLVGAEAFTSTGKEGQWLNHPYSLKTHGDLNGFCSGVNRFIFHAGTHQPWTNRAPGMTYGRCGVHFDWTETWWQQAGPWMTYLSRCQWL
ncbi:MAG: glycosyl hydrolase, partial [Kiritimatiellales bacterium]